MKIFSKPNLILVFFVTFWAVGCAISKSTLESKSILLTVDGMPQNGKCRIIGRIIDRSTNESLVGATVEITSPAYITKTDPKGTYKILELDPGEYSVKAGMPGYKQCNLSNVKTGRDLIIVVNFELASE